MKATSLPAKQPSNIEMTDKVYELQCIHELITVAVDQNVDRDSVEILLKLMDNKLCDMNYTFESLREQEDQRVSESKKLEAVS